MKHITDIFFDLDHTLWDFDKNSEITYKIIFDELKIEVSLIHQTLATYNEDQWKVLQAIPSEKRAW